MALQHLRSSTAHKRPIPTVMSAGQIAINTNEASPALFFKDSNGDLVKVGPVHVGTDAPNSSPASVDATALVTGTVYQILTVGTTDFTLVGASANTVGVIFTATGATTGTGTVSGQQGVEKGEMWLDTTGGTYVLKIYDGTDWRSESGTFVDVSGDTMTGALLLDNAASASAPDLSFDGDADTGVYSPGVDQLAISTGGTGRLFINSSGNVGIGTTSPQSALSFATGSHIGVATTDAADSGVLTIGGAGSAANGRGAYIELYGNENAELGSVSIAAGKGGASAATAGSVIFRTGAGTADERARIDSSGRLLVGTSTSLGQGERVQIAKSDAGDHFGIFSFDATAGGQPAEINLSRSKSDTIGTGAALAADDLLGAINFRGYDGDNYSLAASIFAAADAEFNTSGDTTDSPGRLVFSTTADGAATPTERMRIDSSGRLLVGTSSERIIEPYGLGIDGQSAHTYESVGDSAPGPGIALGSSSTTDRFGPYLYFFRSRGGSVGSNTSVSSGDNLGTISFAGADGADVRTRGAAIYCEVDGTPGANDMPGRLVFSTTADGASTPTERMRIDSSGNVGIGTSSPNAKFEVVESATGEIDVARFRIKGQTNNPMLRILADEANQTISLDVSGSLAGSELVFKEGGSEAVRIDSSGNVGIGTSSPDARLHSRADGDEIKALLYLQNRNGGANAGSQISFSNSTTDLTDTRLAYIRSLTSGAGQNGNNLTFGTNLNGGAPTEHFRIDGAGNVGIGTSSPDAKLKVQPVSSDIPQSAFGIRQNNAADTTQTTLDVEIDPVNSTARILSNATSSPRIGLYTSNQLALYIDESQLVGIGTSSPEAQLHSRADGDEIKALLYLQNRNGGANAGSQISFSNSTTDLTDTRLAYIRSLTSGAGQNGNNLTFGTNLNGGAPQERVRITDGGNVGIGTTTPESMLEIARSTADDNTDLRIKNYRPGIRFIDLSSSTSDGEIVMDAGSMRFRVSAEADANTALTERVRIDSSGNVGIGTTSPASLLHVNGTGATVEARIRNNTTTATQKAALYLTTSGISTFNSAGIEAIRNAGSTDELAFIQGDTEKARIDGSGRLLVGTSSAFETSPNALVQALRTSGAQIALGRSGATASAGNTIGELNFHGSATSGTYSEIGQIKCTADGTHSGTSRPTRLEFSTTAGGASTPTERMRITNDGEVQFGDSTTRNRAITSETDYYSNGRSRLSNSWFVLRKGYKAAGTSVAAEATITLSASAGSPEAFHKIRVIQSGALTRAYYEFLVSEANGTFSVVQDLADYNKAQFTVSMSSPTLTITSGTAAVGFVFLQVEIETFAMGAAEPTVSFATV